jgi:hypothetical protein
MPYLLRPLSRLLALLAAFGIAVTSAQGQGPVPPQASAPVFPPQPVATPSQLTLEQIYARLERTEAELAALRA